MRTPRAVRLGAAAEDSDWEPSDGEEGDASPRTCAHHSHSSSGDPYDAKAPMNVMQTPQPCRTWAAADGIVGEDRSVFSWMRGHHSRSASSDADGAKSPVNDDGPGLRPATTFMPRRTSARGSLVSSSTAQPPPSLFLCHFRVAFHSKLGLALHFSVNHTYVTP
jgi:hypothetical protein